MPRLIVHLDADAFFASVEQAADPRLRGKPIAVGGERRGIIASASYEARKFGVFTPMPTARARKLCPKLVVLSGDFERYEQFSRWMFGYCYDFTPDVEQTSIDEGYFDLTANHQRPAAEIAQTVRRVIGQSLKISVSEGLGVNKLISQIASKLHKPAAFTEVPAGQEISFLHPLPNRWLPGVGPKTSARLNSAGLAAIRHIAATPVDLLELLLGSQAAQLRQFANGVDDRPLIPAREPQKTFSQQETFAQDLTDEGYLDAVLRRMADQLFAKVRADGKSIRTLTVKVRYNDMAEDQCSESLREPTDLETDVYGKLHTMLRGAWKRRVSLRLVSLKLANLYSGAFRTELALDRNAEQHDARERLARVVDELRRVKGATVLLRGHDFRLKEKPVEVSGTGVSPVRSETHGRDACATAPERRALSRPVSGFVETRRGGARRSDAERSAKQQLGANPQRAELEVRAPMSAQSAAAPHDAAVVEAAHEPAKRSAGFPTCCIADFQIGESRDVVRSAGLEARDTADLEVCATRQAVLHDAANAEALPEPAHGARTAEAARTRGLERADSAVRAPAARNFVAYATKFRTQQFTASIHGKTPTDTKEEIERGAIPEGLNVNSRGPQPTDENDKIRATPSGANHFAMLPPQVAPAAIQVRPLRGQTIGGVEKLVAPSPRPSPPLGAGERETERRGKGSLSRCAHVPLRCHSYYSFLNSTLSPKDLVALAAQHDCPAVALTDTGNLHGAAEFAEAAKQAGLKPIFGAELRVGSAPLLLYVQNARGYHNLCRLLSRHGAADNDKSVAAQQAAPITRQLLEALTDGLIAVSSDLSLATLFPNRFYQPAANRLASDRVPAVACPEVSYATPADRLRFDIVQSIRTRTLLRQLHPQKRVGGRFHFRTPAELATGCREHPEWLAHAREIAERCEFDFPFGKPQFPAFRNFPRKSNGLLHFAKCVQRVDPRDGSFVAADVSRRNSTESQRGLTSAATALNDAPSSREFLRRLAMEGLHRRYHNRVILSDTGAVVPLATVQAQIQTELAIIAEVGYEDLFLITWDLLQTCRARGIEWITRGSAADSLVCYCLAISDVCPIRFGLYFRRFLNKERMALHKLPDIDVDFPHDRKDDVVNILFEKYGPEHCAVVGGFSTFQARSAVADVAKVLGVSEFQIRRFTEHFPWSFGGGWIAVDEVRLHGAQLIEKLKASPECRDLPLDEEPFRTAVEMAAFLDGFPRHPKMHPCGVVLSRQPINELTPTFLSNKGWPTTHLDMDAVEAVGLVKMDILAQGGLAVMRDARAALAERGLEVDLNRCVAAERKLAGEQVGKWENSETGKGNARVARASSEVASELLSCAFREPQDLAQRFGEHRDGKFAGPLCPPKLCAETLACLMDGEVPGPDARPRLESEACPLSHLPTFPPALLRAPATAGLIQQSSNPTIHPSPDRLLTSAATSETFNDPQVWEMIASGHARAVHHIESPAMVSLCRMTNVREIDGLIAIVSVIRPGAANEQKKLKFTRRYQKMEPPEYPHPSLEACLRSTFGLVVYEEHILQICEAFAGLSPGRADVLRRALVKQKHQEIETIGGEFAAAARARGHAEAKIQEVWELVTGFNGYAFCKAHSTAYGVEAYQAAWLKRYFPAEFMAGVLTNGKGFYHPLVYVLECHRLGIPLLPPSVNAPGPGFVVETPRRSAGWQPAVSPTGSRQAAPTLATPADCQSATQQTASLRYAGDRPDRLGISLSPPRVNAPGPGFVVERKGTSNIQHPTSNIQCSPVEPLLGVGCSMLDVGCLPQVSESCGSGTGVSPVCFDSHGRDARATTVAIRVPLTRAKGLTERTTDRILSERARAPFTSLADFYRRVGPTAEEMEIIIRVGALDEFGQPRTRQFWEFQQLRQRFGQFAGDQGWLLPPPGLEQLPGLLVEPTRRQRLQWEVEYFDFAASGHPLDLHDDVAWDTYCPVARLGQHVGERVVTCGLIVEQRTHHQVTGEPMKFLSIADRTGIVETELFAATYKSYGLATVRYPVLEIEATVEPYENGRGFSLRVHRAGKPRIKGAGALSSEGSVATSP